MSNSASNPPPRCCCCRCETVVKILSWFFIVTNSLAFVLQLYNKFSGWEKFDLSKIDNEQIPQWLREYLEQQKSILNQHSPPNVLFGVSPLTIMIFAFILIGCHRRKSSFFLLYLLMDAFAIILGMIGVVYLFFTAPKSPIPCLLVAMYTLETWIYSVYFRVYKFIKKEEKGGIGSKGLPHIEEGEKNDGTTGGIHDVLISKPEN